MNGSNQIVQTQQQASPDDPSIPSEHGAASDFEVCPACGRSLRHKDFLDHLFVSKGCMRAYWQEEERTHAYRVRHRSLNRKKEREAMERQRRVLFPESSVLA
jgi:hypothetical protein